MRKSIKGSIGRFLLTGLMLVLALFLVSACSSSSGGGGTSAADNTAPTGGDTPGNGGSSLTTSALEGSWNFNQIETNAPDWQRTELAPAGTGPLAIDSSGDVTGETVDSSGTVNNSSGTTLTAASGIINVTGDPTQAGATDSGNTVAALTGTTGDGNVKLTMLTLVNPTGYSLSDLTGTWMFHIYDSSNEKWSRGPITIDSSGNWSFTMTQQDGNAATPAGTMTIDGTTGIITVSVTSGGGNNPPTAFQCALDSGKTVAVCTMTTGSGGSDTSIGVLVKSNPSFALSTMAGTWQLEQIDYVGPTWTRGSMTFAADGSMSAPISLLESDGETTTSPQSGNASLAADPGSITLPANWNDDAECSFDWSGLIAVCTAGNTIDGVEELSILLKQQ